MKLATLLSFVSAVLAFVISPTMWDEAMQRALMVFAATFLWSLAGFLFLSRIIPAGQSPFRSMRDPTPEGRGATAVVDLETQSIDRAKLQELLR